MIYDDVWWCMVIYGDVWWCMMTYDDGVLFLPWNMRMSASVYYQRDPKGNFGLTGLPRQWGHSPGAALETEKLTKSLMATGSLHTSTRSARIYLSCLVLNNPSLGLQIGSHVRIPGNQRKSDDLDLLSFIVACIPVSASDTQVLLPSIRIYQRKMATQIITRWWSFSAAEKPVVPHMDVHLLLAPKKGQESNKKQ